MTLRIDRLAMEQGPVLRASGRITGDDLPILRAALAESHVVALDLGDIELVDRDAVAFLATLEASGLGLIRCPAFVREWMARERPINDGHGR